MTTCQHCHQPLPEPKKVRECFVAYYPGAKRDPWGTVWSDREQAKRLEAINYCEVIHMREVLPIPKEERKPWTNMRTQVDGVLYTYVQMTPAVRAALMNAGIEL